MADFTGIAPATGFSMGSNGFLIVPERGINLLVLRDGKGWSVRGSDSRIAVKEVSSKDVSDTVQEYVSGLKNLKKDQVEAAVKQVWAACDACTKGSTSRVFKVRAMKGSGLPHIIASDARKSLRVDVAILPYQSFKVAFRFLRHPDGNGGMTAATKFKPEDASSFVAKVNAVFVPQLNMAFELATTDWTTVHRMDQPIAKGPFFEYIAKDVDKDASVTVFHLGRWDGDATDPNGTYFDDRKVIAMDDNPMQPKQVTAEAFTVTLCHELTHFLQHRRKLSGHHGRDRILMSRGIESTIIDKQLVNDLNPW